MADLYKSFFTLSDDEVLLHIRDVFAPELERLKRAYSVRDHNFAAPATPSPSRRLYGQDYDEVNRTLTSVLALRWLANGEYDTFAGSQPPAVRLSRASFDWLRAHFVTFVKKPEDLRALVVAVMINDLGKDDQLAVDYCARTGADIAKLNHDMILVKAAAAGLVPPVDELPPPQRRAVVQGLRLGAQLSFGQLAQAENVPACLAGLIPMRGHPHAFQLHFLEQILDVAGAAGHLNWTCSRTFIEPVLQAYRNVYDAATGVVAGDYGLRGAYDLILARRAQLLQDAGAPRPFDVRGSPSDRALLRLLLMARAADAKAAGLFDETWQALDGATRDTLVKALNVDGLSAAEPAVQATYMPAFLMQAVELESKTASRANQQARLRSTLRYLARVLTEGVQPDGHTTVFERSVLSVMKSVVQTPEFKSNPELLETAEVPETTTLIRDDDSWETG